MEGGLSVALPCQLTGWGVGVWTTAPKQRQNPAKIKGLWISRPEGTDGTISILRKQRLNVPVNLLLGNLRG